MRFLDRLHAPSPILLDGAMGTLIYQHLPRHTGCIELLNLERPDVIRSVHAAYIESGAEIIETNTFGANPLKLAEYGQAARCLEINREAARIAREAAGGRRVFIAGSIGPTGKLIEPMGETSVEEARRAFSMQARALCEGGVDLIIIETMSDLEEARAAYAEEASAFPREFQARFNLGKVLLKLGDRAGYMDNMREVVKLAPKQAEGYLFLARGLLIEQGSLDEIQAMIEKGLSLAQTSELKAFGYFLLADVYDRRHQPEKVSDALEKANEYKSKER